MIKRFKVYLKEAHLTPRQQYGFLDIARDRGFNFDLHRPTPNAMKLSGHIMGDTIEMPMMSTTMQNIHEHLQKHGYTMHYGKKEAYKKRINNRGEEQTITTSIGKALSQTKAPKSLLDSFNNDNHQEAHNLSQTHKVIISRIPHHIAACSTNTPWNSCATLNSWGGPSANTSNGWGDDDEADPKDNADLAAAHLPNDIKEGTHVAYMVPNENKPHDELIRQATGRLLVKPYTSQNGHTVLRSETKGYTAGHQAGAQVPQGFKDTVNNFTDTHFPLHTNTIYHKNPKLYDDDKIKTIAKLDINKPFFNWHTLNSDTKKLAVKNADISPEDIDRTISDIKAGNTTPISDIKDWLPHARNFTDAHMRQYAHPEILYGLHHSTHKKLIEKIKTPNEFNTIVKYNSEYPREHLPPDIDHALINHPLFNDTHMEQMVNGEHIKNAEYGRRIILRHEKLKGALLDNVINKAKTDDRFTDVYQNPNLTTDHINTIIDNLPKTSHNPEHDYSIFNFFNTHGRNFNAEQIHKVLDKKGEAMKDPDFFMQSHINNLSSVISSPHFDLTHYKKLQKILPDTVHDRDRQELHVNIFAKNDAAINNHMFADALKTNDKNHILTPLIRQHTLSPEQLTSLVQHPLSKNNEFAIATQRNLQPEHIKHLFNNNLPKLDEWDRNVFVNTLLDKPKYADTVFKTIAESNKTHPKILSNNSLNHIVKFAHPDVYKNLHPNDQKTVVDRLLRQKNYAKQVVKFNGANKKDPHYIAHQNQIPQISDILSKIGKNDD